MTHAVHEEAEHQSHHSHDPFDRRVAMTMVVVAALLAGVRVLGHRTHNDTLAYRIKAGNARTEESNLWGFRQFKKMRGVLAAQEAKRLLLDRAGGTAAGTPETKSDLPDREKLLGRLEKDLHDEHVDDPHGVAAKILEKGEARYAALARQGVPADRAQAIVEAEMTSARYDAETKAIGKRAEEQGKTAEAYQEKSEFKHHQADYFDLGELGVELALVLCSVSILTKRPGYWYGGMAVCLVGLVLVVAGFVFVHQDGKGHGVPHDKTHAAAVTG